MRLMFSLLAILSEAPSLSCSQLPQCLAMITLHPRAPAQVRRHERSLIVPVPLEMV